MRENWGISGPPPAFGCPVDILAHSLGRWSFSAGSTICGGLSGVGLGGGGL